MANRKFAPARTQGIGHVQLNFSFSPNGSSAPTLSEGAAGWCTVAWTSTGKFTITLLDNYSACVCAQATLALNAIADLKLQWGAIDVVTAKTLVLNVLAVATATDIAANANNKVHVSLTLRNSSVLP